MGHSTQNLPPNFFSIKKRKKIMCKFGKILLVYKISIFITKLIIRLGFSIFNSKGEEKTHISCLIYIFISFLDIAV